MTIVNMVGSGGGLSEKDWNITTSYTDPKITVSVPRGSNGADNRTSYRIARDAVATGYNGKCYKLTSSTRLFSSSTLYYQSRYVSYDITNVKIPELDDWVSTYNIKNASGTVKGYWSTYGFYSNGGYEERVFLTDVQTYNVTVSSGVMTITRSEGTATTLLGHNNDGSYKAYGFFYPTDIDIKVI